MTMNYKALDQRLLTTTAVTACYATPPSATAILSTIRVVNVSTTTPATLKLWQTPTAATAEADAYVFLPPLTLAPGESATLSGPKTLEGNVCIKAQASAANVISILTEGAEVTDVSTTPSWGVAGVKAYKTAAQTLTLANTPYAVTYDAEVFDIGNMHSTSVDTERLTCSVSGLYDVNAIVLLGTTTTAYYYNATIYKYDSAGNVLERVAQIEDRPAARPGATYVTGNLHGYTQMNAGDFLAVVVQTGLAGNTVYGGASGMGAASFSAVRVGYQTNPSQPPAVRTWKSDAGGIATATWTSINMTSEDYDTSTMHDTVTTPSRHYAPSNGIYTIRAQGSVASSAVGYRIAALLKNSGGTYDQSERIAVNITAPVTGDVSTLTTGATVRLMAGDYVELWLWQNSGGTLALSTSTDTTYFEMVKIAD